MKKEVYGAARSFRAATLAGAVFRKDWHCGPTADGRRLFARPAAAKVPRMSAVGAARFPEPVAGDPLPLCAAWCFRRLHLAEAFPVRALRLPVARFGRPVMKKYLPVK